MSYSTALKYDGGSSAGIRALDAEVPQVQLGNRMEFYYRKGTNSWGKKCIYGYVLHFSIT